MYVCGAYCNQPMEICDLNVLSNSNTGNNSVIYHTRWHNNITANHVSFVSDSRYWARAKLSTSFRLPKQKQIETKQYPRMTTEPNRKALCQQNIPRIQMSIND